MHDPTIPLAAILSPPALHVIAAIGSGVLFVNMLSTACIALREYFKNRKSVYGHCTRQEGPKNVIINLRIIPA